MKKKIKLFSTIACCCVALALLSFGVYAATQVSYSVSGTVSYQVKDVLVSFSSTSVQYRFAGASAIPTTTNPTTSMEDDDKCYYQQLNNTTAKDVSIWSAYSNAQNAEYVSHNLGVDSGVNNHTATGVAVKLNRSFLWEVKITFHNDDKSNALNISSNIGTQPTNALITAKTDNPISCAKDSDATLVFYITLTNATASSNGNWNIALLLSK